MTIIIFKYKKINYKIICTETSNLIATFVFTIITYVKFIPINRLVNNLLLPYIVLDVLGLFVKFVHSNNELKIYLIGYN